MKRSTSNDSVAKNFPGRASQSLKYTKILDPAIAMFGKLFWLITCSKDYTVTFYNPIIIFNF